MKATTHTEVYRRFDGELRAHPLRSVVLGWSGIRTGFKKKLPMLLLLSALLICVYPCCAYLEQPNIFVVIKFCVTHFTCSPISQLLSRVTAQVETNAY